LEKKKGYGIKNIAEKEWAEFTKNNSVYGLPMKEKEGRGSSSLSQEGIRLGGQATSRATRRAKSAARRASAGP